MRKEKLGVVSTTIQTNRSRYGCSVSINGMEDISDGTKWEDLIKLLEFNGFKESITFDFIVETGKQILAEKSILYYHEDGLLVWATSCEDGTLLYDGTLYGEVLTLEDPDFVREEMPYCSYDFFEADKFSFEKKISDGVFQFLNEMRQFGDFIPVWQERDKLLWLCSYDEYDDPGFDARKITRDKLYYADDGVRKIIRNLL